jgi:hypothetical protein
LGRRCCATCYALLASICAGSTVCPCKHVGRVTRNTDEHSWVHPRAYEMRRHARARATPSTVHRAWLRAGQAECIEEGICCPGGLGVSACDATHGGPGRPSRQICRMRLAPLWAKTQPLATAPQLPCTRAETVIRFMREWVGGFAAHSAAVRPLLCGSAERRGFCGGGYRKSFPDARESGSPM